MLALFAGMQRAERPTRTLLLPQLARADEVVAALRYKLGWAPKGPKYQPPALFTDCAHPPLLAPGLIETQVDYELHPPGNPCREAPQRKPLGRSIVNRTAAAVCLATWHVNAAATRARKRFCDARPPAPVKLFTLATTCAPGMRGFHNNANGGS